MPPFSGPGLNWRQTFFLQDHLGILCTQCNQVMGLCALLLCHIPIVVFYIFSVESCNSHFAVTLLHFFQPLYQQEASRVSSIIAYNAVTVLFIHDNLYFDDCT